MIGKSTINCKIYSNKKIFFICDPRLIDIYKRYFLKINNNNFEIEKEYKQKKISKHIAVEMLGKFFANNKNEINKFLIQLILWKIQTKI